MNYKTNVKGFLKVSILVFLFIAVGCEKEKQESIVEKTYNGDVVLRTQQEVNSFADSNYTNISGNFEVGSLDYLAPSNITNH